MKQSILATAFLTLSIAARLWSQAAAPEGNAPVSTLHVTTRAVLLDVVVTDKSGMPVTGLKKDAFTVMEQGTPQNVSFFEEQNVTTQPTPVELPKMPPNVFCNFSPVAKPPAVTVLLLDSLNTPMEDQGYVHQQAMKFLKGLKPGSRMAIFTMSLGLHFIQGFTDDPALLVAALGNKKTNEMEVPALIKSQEEDNAQQSLVGLMSQAEQAGSGATTTIAPQGMIDALNNFFQVTDTAQGTDRAYRTMENLQKLAGFLGAFPGRKNLIWFSESFPVRLFGDTDQRLESDLKKTVNLLTAARIAVYPVDARGVKGYGFYEAGDTLHPMIGTTSQMIGNTGIASTAPMGEDMQRATDQETMRMLAQESGGKAFANINGLSDVVANLATTGGDFYTLSYTPLNAKMDGKLRHIEVKVNGGKYNLSYRRGYYASDEGLPGTITTPPPEKGRNKAAVVPGPTDPLRPFMDFGMPQTEQILYKTLIQPLQAAPQATGEAGEKPVAAGARRGYTVDFAIDFNDVKLLRGEDGLYKGALNISLIVYDRYGETVTRKDHQVSLNVKPDVYAVFQKAGVQLHAEIEVPKGQFWLRTGVYDQLTHKVGTLEVPLNQVKRVEMAAGR